LNVCHQNRKPNPGPLKRQEKQQHCLTTYQKKIRREDDDAGTTNNNSNMKYTSLPLLLQDINIVVVTDVHSWVAGHGRHEPKYDADYGDVLSFYQHLQRQVTASSSSSSGKSRDVYFVMNGDFVDGTGLSAVPPSHLVPILERMPFDAVNMGNHELYHDETVEFLVYGSSSSSKNATGEGGSFIDHWDGNYLTSNTLLKSTNEPIGNRYTYLRGDSTNSPTLLTFGFLYNFQNNCPTTVVESVEGTVSERWFRDALLRRDDYDAILVLAHMDAVDSLVYVILEAIRSITDTDDVPIVFVTGHSHRRAYEVLDANAVSFEAGHFLDTVGFVSFPLPEKNDAASSGNGTSKAAATNFSWIRAKRGCAMRYSDLSRQRHRRSLEQISKLPTAKR